MSAFNSRPTYFFPFLSLLVFSQYFNVLINVPLKTHFKICQTYKHFSYYSYFFRLSFGSLSQLFFQMDFNIVFAKLIKILLELLVFTTRNVFFLSLKLTSNRTLRFLFICCMFFSKSSLCISCFWYHGGWGSVLRGFWSLHICLLKSLN